MPPQTNDWNQPSVPPPSDDLRKTRRVMQSTIIPVELITGPRHAATSTDSGYDHSLGGRYIYLGCRATCMRRGLTKRAIVVQKLTTRVRAACSPVRA
jgi:hypothetical protein